MCIYIPEKKCSNNHWPVNRIRYQRLLLSNIVIFYDRHTNRMNLLLTPYMTRNDYYAYLNTSMSI